MNFKKIVDTSFRLCVSFYKVVLSMFKLYVILFEREEPLIHKAHYDQLEIIKRFLSYFVLPSKLGGVKSGKGLKKLRITENDLLPNDIILTGSEARKIIKNNADDNAVKEFMDIVEKCYLECH